MDRSATSQGLNWTKVGLKVSFDIVRNDLMAEV